MMYNDLMLFYSFYLIVILLLSTTTNIIFGQQTIVYVKRGDTAELCDNRSTSIYAYEYRSFDGKKNLIVEPIKHERYSNPYQTSVLRITNVNDNDSGLYKCPQDDTEWQKLQIYEPVQHVYLNNLHTSFRIYNSDFCGNGNSNCLTMTEDEPLDIICAADGHPRPAVDIFLDKNGTIPKIMALAANDIKTPSTVNDQFKPSVYEAYRIIGLTSADNGRNITCQVDMKQIDKSLSLSITKQLYIEFRPIVNEKMKKIYSGINQTRTVNCTVQRANPSYIHYSINGLSPTVLRRIYGEQHDFHYTFDITPTSLEHFHQFNVTANNSIGFDTCTYELIHGGVPDKITYCTVDTYTSNVTITISCLKSYAQGDNEGYACTLFKYNDKGQQKMFEEIARTKSCIFALENFHDPVEFRVAAFNRYGSLPVNPDGYVIQINQPIVQRETSFFTRRVVIILGSIIGGILLVVIICCLCGGVCCRDRSKYSDKHELYHKNNDTIRQLVDQDDDKHHHQNGAVYDVPSQAANSKYTQQMLSTPPTSAYHQQNGQQSNNDRDSLTSSLNSGSTRTRIVNNKCYGNPIIDNRYGILSPTTMVVPTRKGYDDEEGDESPVYSTTTDIVSENGSFLVPSSSKRYVPPPPKPRYSTLGAYRSPSDNLDKTPLPLPRPRSRSNSRTRLNNANSDNTSCLYEERPVSSSDSGIGPPDVGGLHTGDTNRTGLGKSRHQPLTSPVVRGTEC